MSYIALSFLIASFIFFGFGILASIKHYNRRFSLKYDVRSFFPYELNYEAKFSDNLLGNLLLVLSFLFMGAFFCFYNNNPNNGFLIFIMIAGIINVLTCTVSFFLPLKYLKAHLAVVVFLFCFSFLLNAGIAIAAVSNYSSNKNVGLIVLAIIAIIFALIIFIVVLNPKLVHFDKLKKVTNEDGSVKYIRPKYFVLAFSEWICIFLNYLSMIVVLLLPLFIK